MIILLNILKNLLGIVLIVVGIHLTSEKIKLTMKISNDSFLDDIIDCISIFGLSFIFGFGIGLLLLKV